MTTITRPETSGGGIKTDVIISADSHVIEPGDLWTSKLKGRFGDAAPNFSARANNDTRGMDPTRRLSEMMEDGVSAEVLYPTRGLGLFGIEDPALQEACFEVYNDWIMDYCSVNPDRLVGIPCIPIYDVNKGIKEMERCLKQGMKGALIWEVPHPDYPLSSPHYEPFWEAAQDLGAPINVHILTGFNYTRNNPNRHGGIDHYRDTVNHKVAEAVDALFNLIFFGILDRYPRLKFVIVESEIGWIPFFLQQWDYYAKRHAKVSPLPFEHEPSFYFHRQVWATFFNDAVGGHLFDWFGQDKFMWSSDFPHPNSTWPNSDKVIARDMGNLPKEVQEKLLCTNVAKLYDLPIPEPAVVPAR
jgi:predicted TIM-barrel fold metal-dependent hydrolase